MIQAKLGIHVLQVTILVFEFFQSLHLARFHPAVLRSPVVERSITHTVFATGVFDRLPGFDFLQNLDDLRLAEPRFPNAAYSLPAGILSARTKLCAALLTGMITYPSSRRISVTGTLTSVAFKSTMSLAVKKT